MPLSPMRKDGSDGNPRKKARKAAEAEVQEVETEVPRKKARKAAVEGEVSTTEAEKTGADALTGTMPVKEVEGLSKVTRKALKARGISSLFEVQHRSFTPAFSGKDVVGRAKTGCGKTLAFCLPIIERIIADELPCGKALMLCLAPTRELARQIFKELDSVGDAHGLKSTCLYGGTAFWPQVDEIRQGRDCIVATPGRLLDHLNRGTLSLDACRFLVLDEADEMLSMGFQEEVESIMQKVPENGQKMLFSATMPKWVKLLVAKHLKKDVVTIDVVADASNEANAQITHQCIACHPAERGDTLADLCKVHAGAFGKTLVFTDTKKECDELATHPGLVQMGAGQLHGDIPQATREVTMENFRAGKIKLLIATDVAARGLDVPNVDLVVQTHPPSSLDTYVHRAGRTARAGRTGTCITFYSMNEEYLVRLLQNQKGIPIKRRGPAQPSEIVDQAARDAVRKIDYIHQDNVDAFAKVAEELLTERGSPTFLLAAALAAMAGYTQRIKVRSLLSSFEGAVAMLLESDREIESPSKAWYLLRQNLPSETAQSMKGVSVCKGRYSAVFDCPQDLVDQVLGATVWKGVKFSECKELPELEGKGSTMADDLNRHKDAQKNRWDRIKNAKAREAGERDERRQFMSENGKGKGKGKGKSKGKGNFEENSADGGGGRGGGRGGGLSGRGGGRGGGRGRF